MGGYGRHRGNRGNRCDVFARYLDRRTLLRAGAIGAAGVGAAALVPSAGAARLVAAQENACGGGDVEITYGFWNAEQWPAIEVQIEAFQEQFPDISVSPQIVPFADYFTKLQTGIAGGETYDIFWMNGPNFPVYAPLRAPWRNSPLSLGTAAST